jgi:hypothetical protein
VLVTDGKNFDINNPLLRFRRFYSSINAADLGNNKRKLFAFDWRFGAATFRLCGALTRSDEPKRGDKDN